MADEIHAPVWAREEAFPEKPTSGAFSLYGFVNSKGQKISAESLADLTEKISKSRERVSTDWSPENDRMQVPEEVQEIRSTLWKRRRDWAEGDISDGKRMCALFGVALLWSLFAGFQNRGGDIIDRGQNDIDFHECLGIKISEVYKIENISKTMESDLLLLNKNVMDGIRSR